MMPTPTCLSPSSLPPTPTRQRRRQTASNTGTPTGNKITKSCSGSTSPTLGDGDGLDISFGTAVTEASTYISDISSPMHHSPYSFMDTSCEVSEEFLQPCHLQMDSDWKHDGSSPHRADNAVFDKANLATASMTTSGIVHSSNILPRSSQHDTHIRTSGSLESDSFVEFRCPSPSFHHESNRRALRAKRRIRMQQQQHQAQEHQQQHNEKQKRPLDDPMTKPLGISERRRPFHQASVFSDNGMILVTPSSSSEDRSSPDTCTEYGDTSNKPVAAKRLRRSLVRSPHSESEVLLLRQPLAQMQLSIKRLRPNGVAGVLCLAGFCFMGMIFVTNRVFFHLEDHRLRGFVERPVKIRRRITSFQADSPTVHRGGLQSVVSYATSWKQSNRQRAVPLQKEIAKVDQRHVVSDKRKSKMSVDRHNNVIKQKKNMVKRLSLHESLPSRTILAEVEEERRRIPHGPGIVLAPPSALWVSKTARFDLMDAQMYQTSGAEIPSSTVAPRVLYLDDSWTSVRAMSRRIEDYPPEFTDNTQLYSILDSADERLQRMELREPFVQGECVPMQDWQTNFYPSCNGMHELGMESMGEDDVYNVELFGTKGYWRNAWKIESLANFSETGSQDKFVVKTLKFEHNFEEAHFEHSRIDAVAMERLTASPHVINIFGFCGHSVLTEYADGKRVGELADKMKRSPLARLRIARDIANGLADVHGIDGDGNATFVHFDVNLANVVSIGGTLKLNDFNIGIIRRWNTTSNTPCGFPAQYPNPQWRSPEEARNEQNLTEKVDVFSMGHIFFRLICSHEPWNKLEPGGKPSKEVITEKVQKGVLPFILPEVMNTTDKEVAAIRDAMLQCYTFDPQKRPSARDIARYLERALVELSSQQQQQQRT